MLESLDRPARRGSRESRETLAYNGVMKFRYETLEIWQLAMKLWERWQQIRTMYPKQEQYKLVDQLDRAIEGIGSVIVEGSAKNSAKDFGRYIDMARGSLLESRNHFYLSNKKGYISEDEFRELDALIEKIFFKAIGFQKWLLKNDSRVSREP